MKKRVKIIAKNIIICLLSYIGLVGIILYSSNEFKNVTYLYIFAYVAIIILLINTIRINKRIKFLCFLMGFLCGLSTVLGKVITYNESLHYITSSPKALFNIIVMILGLTIVIGAFFAIIVNKLNQIIDIKVTVWKLFKMKYSYYCIWIIIFLSWIPCLLAFYPGNYSFDMPFQTLKNKQHPLLHTLFWKICVRVDDITHIDATLVYSIIQMLILSAVFAMIIKMMIDKNIPNIATLFSIIFFSINPVMPLMAISTTKDVLFAATMIVVTKKIYDLVSIVVNDETITKKEILKYSVAVLLMCFMRNNAAYAFLGLLPFLVWGLRKQWKTILISSLVPVILYLVINGPFFSYIGVASSPTVEVLAVPIQQMANMVNNHYNELDKEDQRVVDDMMDHKDIKKYYEPDIVDPIKNNMNVNHTKATTDYIKVWLKYLKKYPVDYMDAFLKLNLTTWAPDTQIQKELLKRGYIGISSDKTPYFDKYLDEYKINRSSKLPFLKKIYSSVEKKQMFAKIPVLSVLFSLSFPLWFLLFTALVLLVRRKTILLLPLMLGFMYILTTLLGPGSLTRYVFPVLVLCPLYITIMFDKNNNTISKFKEKRNK